MMKTQQYGDQRLRPLIKGGDERHRTGATFFPPKHGMVRRLTSELQANMSPSCPRTYHGVVVETKDQVQWTTNNQSGDPMLGISCISEQEDVREFTISVVTM